MSSIETVKIKCDLLDCGYKLINKSDQGGGDELFAEKEKPATKPEIIAELKSLGVAFDSTAKKQDLEAILNDEINER